MFSGIRIALATLVLATGCSGVFRLPESPEPIISPEQLAAAIRFRAAVGFRAEPEYVLALAGDPRSRAGMKEYAAPLTLEELAELRGRARNADEIQPIIKEYGSTHPDAWAGTFTDHDGGGVVVGLFTSDLAEHEAAIRRLTAPEARFEVRHARWTLRELQELQRRIERGRSWFLAQGPRLAAVGLDPHANRVMVEIGAINRGEGDLRFRTRDPQLEATIERHFSGAEMIAFRWGRTVYWQGPRGRMVIRVVDAMGRAVPDIECVPTPDDPGALQTGDIGISTGPDGTCEVEAAGATGYDVEVGHHGPGGAWSSLGRGRVVVPPSGVGRVQIVVGDSQD